jgi:hypothetical protein
MPFYRRAQARVQAPGTVGWRGSLASMLGTRGGGCDAQGMDAEVGARARDLGSGDGGSWERLGASALGFHPGA